MDIVPPKDKVLMQHELTLINPTPNNQSVEGGSGSHNMNLDANCSENYQRKDGPSVYQAIRLPEVSPIIRPKFLDPVLPRKGPLQSEEAHHHQQIVMNQQKKKNLKKPGKKHKCNICGYSTVKKILLLSHKEAHTRDQKMKCQICSYSTNIKRCLTLHLNRDHSNINPIADENAIREGIERDHPNEKFEDPADAGDNGLQIHENPEGLSMASPFYGFESRKVPHPFESAHNFSLRKKSILLKKKNSKGFYSFKHTAFRKKRLFKLGFPFSCLKKTNASTRKRCQELKHKFKISNKKSKLNFRRSFMDLRLKNQQCAVFGSEYPPQRPKIYKCALCGFTVSDFPCNADKILKHEKSHVVSQLHKCSRCTFSHRCLNILNIHLKCHHRSIDRRAGKIDDTEKMEDRDYVKDANLEINGSKVTIIARDSAQEKENGSESFPGAMEEDSSEPPDLGNDIVMDGNRIEFDNPPDLEDGNNALRSTIPQMQPGSEISIPPKDPEPTTSFHLTNGPNEDLSLRLELNPEASKLTEVGNDVDQQVVPSRAVETIHGDELQSQSGPTALVHEQLEISNPREAQGDVILLTCTDRNQSEGNNLESNDYPLIEASMSWLQRFFAFLEPAVEQTSKLLDSQELREQLAIAEVECRQLIDELLRSIQSDSTAIEQMRNCMKHRQLIRSEKEQNINLAQINLNAAKEKVRSTEQVRVNFLAKEKDLREFIRELNEKKLEFEEALLSNQLKVDEAVIESQSFIKTEDEISESATLRKEIRSIQQSLSELKEDLDVQLSREKILKEDRQRAVEDRKTASDQMCNQQLHLRDLQRDLNALGLSIQDQSEKLKNATMLIVKKNEIRCQLHCCVLNIELLKRISG